MSLSAVWRVHVAGASAIVKVSPSRDEARFYEQIAPSLRTAGVPIPELELALHEPDSHWLVIEDIPTPLLVGHLSRLSPFAVQVTSGGRARERRIGVRV